MKKLMAVLIVLLMIVVEIRFGGVIHTPLWMRCVALALVLIGGRANAHRRALRTKKEILLNNSALHQQPALA